MKEKEVEILTMKESVKKSKEMKERRKETYVSSKSDIKVYGKESADLETDVRKLAVDIKKMQSNLVKEHTNGLNNHFKNSKGLGSGEKQK
jgi:hypothetical protein